VHPNQPRVVGRALRTPAPSVASTADANEKTKLAQADVVSRWQKASCSVRIAAKWTAACCSWREGNVAGRLHASLIMRDADSRTTPLPNPSTAISPNTTRTGFSDQDGKPAASDFAYSGPLTEAALLGNVAYRAVVNRMDSKNLRARNCPAAEQFVQHQYRRAGNSEQRNGGRDFARPQSIKSNPCERWSGNQPEQSLSGAGHNGYRFIGNDSQLTSTGYVSQNTNRVSSVKLEQRDATIQTTARSKRSS